MKNVTVFLLLACRLAVCEEIPKTWDNRAIATLEVPLSHAEYSPVHILADFYYQMEVRPIFKSYPIYAPWREPAGYQEWLRQQEPVRVFDPSALRTPENWIQAGEVVFEAPILYDTDGPFAGGGTGDLLKDPNCTVRPKRPSLSTAPCRSCAT